MAGFFIPYIYGINSDLKNTKLLGQNNAVKLSEHY
jgi:hypothetical protein